MWPLVDEESIDLSCAASFIGSQVSELQPSSYLPLKGDEHKRDYRQVFRPDPGIDSEIARRVSQGRAHVFSAACNAINPLQGLLEPVSYYRLNELAVRVGVATHRDVLCLNEDELAGFVKFLQTAGCGPPRRLVVHKEADQGSLLESTTRRELQAHQYELAVVNRSGDSRDAQTIANFLAAVRSLLPGGDLLMSLPRTPERFSNLACVLYAAKLYFRGTCSLVRLESTAPTDDEVFLVAQDYTGPLSEVWLDWEQWLERSKVDAYSGVPPLSVPNDFSTGLDYCLRAWQLLRQESQLIALRLVKSIVKYRPMARESDMQLLVDSCKAGESVRALAEDYKKRFLSNSANNSALLNSLQSFESK